MKKLNITKKQFGESKYFTNKYGSLKYVSESGKLYKTDKGFVLALESEEEEEKKEAEDVEVTRGELTDMLKDVVSAVEKVCDEQDVSFEAVVGIEPEGEAEEADASEVIATGDEVAEVLQGVIDKVEDIAEKNDIELPEAEPEQADESLADIGNAIKKTGGEMVDKVKKGVKKGMTAIGDKFHGIYRKNDKVSIKGKAGDVDGVVVKASPEEVIIKPDNERSFDEDTTTPEVDGEKLPNAPKCECGCPDGKCECVKKESVNRKIRARLFREKMARRAKARKVLESIRRRRAFKKVLESRKARKAR